MTHSQARRNMIARQSGEHCHDFSQLLFGWRGKMACEFESNSSLLDNGTLAIVPGSAVHTFNGLSEDSELLVIDVSATDPYTQALELACGLSFKDTIFSQPEFISLSPDALPLLDFAAQQLKQSNQRHAQALNCQLVSLFMTQLCSLYSPEKAKPVSRGHIDANELNRYIDQSLSQPLSNAALAEKLNLSESYFYAIFQQQFGISPQKYLMSRRLQAARHQLLTSRKTLATLAEELGFHDASSLSRAFKKHFGRAPGALRREHHS